ncbi:MAG: NAD(P)/FAD-dependent oxidoreductase [Actinobacteria bacterium]|nr:MAG: NAD(P)/FAD-dependent oxidoreductase [Actinomycetota bacterium]
MRDLIKTDVLIVGAGPAGSTAACFLAHNKIDHLLVEKEKFPRDKICGGGLTAHSVEVINELGLKEKIESLPHFKFYGYKIYSNNGVVYSQFHDKNQDYGYVIKRSDFDEMLLNHAKDAGTKLLMPVGAIEIDENKDGSYLVKLSDNQVVHAQFIIASDGSGGSFSRKINPSYSKAETIATRAYFENVTGIGKDLEFLMEDSGYYGYGWIFPLSPTSANVGAGADISYLKKYNLSVLELYKRFLTMPPLNKMLKEARQVTKAESYPLRMNYPRKTLVHNRVLFVGDAADLIYPLSGEGISYAMKSGQVAAEALTNVLKTKPYNFKALNDYNKFIKKEYGDFKLAHRVKASLAWPPFQRFLVGTAVKDKYLGDLAVSVLENTVSCKNLLRPKIWLRLFQKGLFEKKLPKKKYI